MDDRMLAGLEARMYDLDEGWAVDHARRLSRLVARIGAGLELDDEVLSLAIWTHDWGAFAAYGAAGPDHPRRSAEVVRTELLGGWRLEPARARVLLEAVERHDYRDRRPVVSLEALVLREADMLDLIGAVGIAREFAWGPDLGSARRRLEDRLAVIPARLTLPAAKQLGDLRAGRMAEVLGWYDAEIEGADAAPDRQPPTERGVR